MAAIKSAQSSKTSPQTSCVDPLDFDQYFNFEQNFFPSPTLSPESAASKSAESFHSSLGNPNNTLLPSQPSSQRTYAGPSHQYELHKQQAGLPVGALANTLAVNQADYLDRRQLYFGNTDGYSGMNNTDDLIDFGTAPVLNPSLGFTSDIDMEFDSSEFISNNPDYVDPAAIGGQERIPAIQHPQGNVGRVWPGMHQQAALAKAQAQAEQQKKLQAQAKQSHKSAPQPHRRSNGSASRPPTDPIVEERISRLLKQMRHSSVTSSNDDDSATSNANGTSAHSMRIRKDEEDMDEDEKLLASEEGKKLSSKERRQLRNKVSARAFRSRRKEYIGQLEGEIATKTAEAEDLKVRNEELMLENTRLTDLTRMLLEHEAFQTFLKELSDPNGNHPAVPASASARSQSSKIKSEQPQPTPRKDVNPHQAITQQAQVQHIGPQIGMALIPESHVNYPNFVGSTNPWTESMDFSLYNTQVFAVTELPQGPAVDHIDVGLLSGKSSNSVGSYPPSEPKDDVPLVERMPFPEKVEVVSDLGDAYDDVELDESDPAFALFSDCPPPSATTAVSPSDQIFGTIELDKVFIHLELLVGDETNVRGEISTATMERFERLCSGLDASSKRISAMTERP